LIPEAEGEVVTECIVQVFDYLPSGIALAEDTAVGEEGSGGGGGGGRIYDILWPDCSDVLSALFLWDRTVQCLVRPGGSSG